MTDGPTIFIGMSTMPTIDGKTLFVLPIGLSYQHGQEFGRGPLSPGDTIPVDYCTSSNACIFRF